MRRPSFVLCPLRRTPEPRRLEALKALCLAIGIAVLLNRFVASSSSVAAPAQAEKSPLNLLLSPHWVIKKVRLEPPRLIIDAIVTQDVLWRKFGLITVAMWLKVHPYSSLRVCITWGYAPELAGRLVLFSPRA